VRSREKPLRLSAADENTRRQSIGARLPEYGDRLHSRETPNASRRQDLFSAMRKVPWQGKGCRQLSRSYSLACIFGVLRKFEPFASNVKPYFLIDGIFELLGYLSGFLGPISVLRCSSHMWAPLMAVA
jgi:hypothetical protein